MTQLFDSYGNVLLDPEAKSKTEWPEGTILLLNGSSLTCYPKENLKPQGKYKFYNEKEEAAKKVIYDAQIKLFTDNAAILLQHKERVFSDSRMFLCPIPVRNGLAYSGTFPEATLGVYLEWWSTTYTSVRLDYRNLSNSQLVYNLSGSPLSGSNRCGLVNATGEREFNRIGYFHRAFSTFCGINSRYKNAKEKYQAYSIDEVIRIFKEEGLMTFDPAKWTIFFQDAEIQILRYDIDALNKEKALLWVKNMDFKLLPKKKELEKLVEEYRQLDEKCNARIAELQQFRLRLRRQMHDKEITSKQYQRLWHPYHKELDELRVEAGAFARRGIYEILGMEPLDINDIQGFLKRYNAQSQEKQGIEWPGIL